MSYQVDSIISADYLIPVVPEQAVWEKQAIAIDKGIICDIGGQKEIHERYQAQNTYELGEQVLLPGFINAHTHSPMNLLRGLADDLSLQDWLQKHIWPAEQKIMNAESISLGSKLSIAEMLLSGTTCFNDHFYFPEQTAKAAVEAGMRATIGLQVMDTPTQWAKDTAESLEKNIQVLENFSANPLIRWSFAPQGTYTNGDDSLRAIKAAADKYQLPIYIHLHENAAEIQGSIEQYGKRPIQRLTDLGLMENHLIAVHMVHVNDDDLELCKKYQPFIVHCPESNLKLASGFANVQRMLDAGLNVSLGTDGVASNNDLDMIGEMRSASFIAKALTQSAANLPAQQILSMATINGAHALGIADQVGSLEKGKAADIIAIDLNHIFMQPCFNPISQIVYAGSRQHCSHVWINGVSKVANHQLVDMDVDALLQEAKPYWRACQPFKHPA